MKNIRRGFAIPAVLLTLIVMSVMIAAGFSLVNSEMRGVNDQKAQVTAFMLAEQGLQTFIVKRDSLGFKGSPPATREGPVRIMMDGGYADVQMDKVRVPTSLLLGLYAIRSRGVLNGNPPAVRTVAQYAEWSPALIDLDATWTAITGIRKTGLLGLFRGIDQCGDSAALPGLGVVSGIVQSLPLLNLNLFSDSLRTLGSTISQASDAVKIDWSGIVNGTSLVPDYTIPANSIPSFADTTVYPVIKVDGDLSASSALSGGRGLLIVTGDLKGNAATFNWKGLVLVGGTISGNFSSTIEGGIISSLNVKLGQSVDVNYAEGNKVFKYSSCAVAKALQSVGSLVPLSNAWVDNWVEY
jgi:hypothetical protein